MAITDLEPRLLVEAHNGGDEQAFSHIVRVHHPGLLAHAISRLHDVQAAEDAVQETFVRAYRAMPRFEGDFHLRAWLHRILTNVCHDEGSRRQRDGLLVERVSSQAVVGGEPADIDIERIDVSCDVVTKALAQLPVSYREALVLRYVEELSYEEVAATVGVTEGNARVRVMRGRVALKRALASSHAVAIGLLPWLRRGVRGPVAPADLQLGVASATASAAGAPSLLAGSPLLVRATEVAPQLAERLATLPQVLGLVATMAVPIAAPVVGTQVADWVSAPPAATAAPAELVADVVVPVAPTRPVPDRSPGDETSVAVAPSVATPTTVADAPVASELAPVAPVVTEPDATTTSTPPPVSTTVAPPRVLAPQVTPAPRTAPPTTAPPRAAGPGRRAPTTVPAPIAPPAPPPPAAFASSLVGAQLTSVGDERTELAGQVRWSLGATSSAGDLRGTLTFDGPTATPSPSSPGVGAPVPDPQAAPRRFTGEMALSLGDGRSYRLLLTDGTLDASVADRSMSARFELRDGCGAVVASGAVTGALDLESAPVPSAVALTFDGLGPAVVPTCG